MNNMNMNNDVVYNKLVKLLYFEKNMLQCIDISEVIIFDVEQIIQKSFVYKGNFHLMKSW